MQNYTASVLRLLFLCWLEGCIHTKLLLLFSRVLSMVNTWCLGKSREATHGHETRVVNVINKTLVRNAAPNFRGACLSVPVVLYSSGPPENSLNRNTALIYV